jgi:hypothetical protein
MRQGCRRRRTTEAADGLGFPTEVGLDNLLASGVLGGDV